MGKDARFIAPGFRRWSVGVRREGHLVIGVMLFIVSLGRDTWIDVSEHD